MEGCDNDKIMNISTRDFTPQNKSIQLSSKKDHCHFHNDSWIDSHRCHFKNSSDGTFLEKCHRWVYDTSVFHSTIVSDVSESRCQSKFSHKLLKFVFLFQFNLTCENEWKQTVANSLFMFGMLIGAVTIGFIGDT